ncbi:MAG: hypothetical protein ABEJ94_09415 [Halorientalis sp.]
MRGTVGAILRTVLVAAGIAVLLAGIVTLAFPQLLTGLLDGGRAERVPGQRGSAPGWDTDTLLASVAGIVGGLTITAAGLAIPGRSSRLLLREQAFTRAQRLSVLLGALFAVGPPALFAAGLDFGNSLLAALVAVLLALFGGLLVLVGTVRGLRTSQRRPPGQNS